MSFLYPTNRNVSNVCLKTNDYYIMISSYFFESLYMLTYFILNFTQESKLINFIAMNINETYRRVIDL